MPFTSTKQITPYGGIGSYKDVTIQTNKGHLIVEENKGTTSYSIPFDNLSGISAVCITEESEYYKKLGFFGKLAADREMDATREATWGFFVAGPLGAAAGAANASLSKSLYVDKKWFIVLQYRFPDDQIDDKKTKRKKGEYFGEIKFESVFNETRFVNSVRKAKSDWYEKLKLDKKKAAAKKLKQAQQKKALLAKEEIAKRKKAEALRKKKAEAEEKKKSREVARLKAKEKAAAREKTRAESKEALQVKGEAQAKSVAEELAARKARIQAEVEEAAERLKSRKYL